MTDPITLAGTTPCFALPLLFAGQVQKELTVNEALQRTDLLLACAIEGVVSAPPAAPAEGNCWLIGTAPSGLFAGHSDEIAGWTASGWRYVAPREGLRIFDRSGGSFRLFRAGAWCVADAPASPSGGTTIDVECRATIQALIAALRLAGVLR